MGEEDPKLSSVTAASPLEEVVASALHLRPVSASRSSVDWDGRRALRVRRRDIYIKINMWRSSRG